MAGVVQGVYCLCSRMTSETSGMSMCSAKCRLDNDASCRGTPLYHTVIQQLTGLELHASPDMQMREKPVIFQVLLTPADNDSVVVWIQFDRGNKYVIMCHEWCNGTERGHVYSVPGHKIVTVVAELEGNKVHIYI